MFIRESEHFHTYNAKGTQGIGINLYVAIRQIKLSVRLWGKHLQFAREHKK